MLTEERTRTDQSKVKKALVTAGIILLAILLSVGASILACKKSASTVKDGLSAYEIAQAYGYEGTVQDWLASLNGKSAYEIAKESGYTGTESDFSASLAANAKGDAVSIKSASFNRQGELILLLSDGQQSECRQSCRRYRSRRQERHRWCRWQGWRQRFRRCQHH